MKITFLSPVPNMSGGERVVATYADKLVERGHDVTIVACNPFAKRFVLNPREALRRRARRRALKNAPYHRMKAKLKVIGRKGRILEEDAPQADVLIATWWETAVWGAEMAPDKGAKVYFMQDYGASGQEFERIRPTWRLPYRFVTLTGLLKGMILEEAPDAKVDVVLNAVEDRFRGAPVREKAARPTVGFVFRPEPSKGIDVAVDALARVRAATPDLRVVAFGKPQTSLPDFVEYRENASDDDIVALYRSADLWLFPSRMEGFGLPILEAMASRTPVVGARCGAAPDLIEDGRNGYVVEVGDAEAMADRIRRVLSARPDDWARMSETAAATIEDYDWDDAADRFEAALKAAAEARGA
ncbi:MAG: glycosyltransferase family 4 protein [Pseudomonadota bacterium]